MAALQHIFRRPASDEDIHGTELYLHWNRHLRCEAYKIVAPIDQRHFNLVNIKANQKLLGAHAHLRLVFFSETHMSVNCVWDYI